MTASISFKEFEQFVIDFVTRGQPGYNNKMVRNLLAKEKKTGLYDEGCFLGQILSLTTVNGVVDEDIYNESVAACVRGYTSVKDNAIDIFQRLTARLNDAKVLDFHPSFPKIPISNSFERLMYISKYIQNPGNKISDLEEVLWVSHRTIESDLARLRGDEDPIQICGKKYVIKDIDRERDHIVDMASTSHPFFLTCNLTQVIVMLKGLKEISANPAMYGYAMTTAREIWEQLSEYAQSRILYVTEQLLSDQVEWYRNLNRAETGHEYGDECFWPEYYCTSYGSNAIMECLKNRMPCYIEYKTPNGSEFYKDVIIKQIRDHSVCILYDENEIILDMNNILRSSTHKEYLY